MAYYNNYNIRIANKLKKNIMDSIQNEHNNMSYYQPFKMNSMVDSMIGGNALEDYEKVYLNEDNYNVSGPYAKYSSTKYNDDLEGKGGYNILPGTHLDTGFEKTKGLLKKKTGSKKLVKKGGAKEEIKLTRIIGGKKRGRPSKMKGGTELGLPLSFFSEDSKEVQEVKKRKMLKEKKMKEKEKEMKDKILEDNKESTNLEEPITIEGNGKKKVKKTVKGGKLLDKSVMRATVQGAGKKSRSEIVKEVMKNKGLKMIEASKYVKEHKLY